MPALLLALTCWSPPPPRPAQPVNYNLVGGAGRFETGRLLFRPLPGDVGACDASDAACSGLAANSYFLLRNQRLWRCALAGGAVSARARLSGALELRAGADLAVGREMDQQCCSSIAQLETWLPLGVHAGPVRVSTSLPTVALVNQTLHLCTSSNS